MKLAEGLNLRADIKKRLAQTQARILENCRVQEGDAPGEDPNALIAEFDALVKEFEGLVERINRTNLAVEVGGLGTMTRALAKRDSLKILTAMKRAAADAAVGKQTRVTRSEVKFVATVSIRALRDEADSLSRQHRELDSAIQAANWTHDLLD